MGVILGITGLWGCKDESVYIGDGFFNQGNYEKAIEAYTNYLELNPNNIKSLYNRGRAYEELGNYELALADFNKVLENDPNHVQSRLSIAINLYRNKLYMDVIYVCDNVLETHSQNADAFLLRGKSHQKAYHINLAMDDYNAAIAVNNERGEAYFYRGLLKIYLGRKQSACSDFKIAESLDIKTAVKALKNYCR